MAGLVRISIVEIATIVKLKMIILLNRRKVGEAIRKFKAGDRSEQVLGTLEPWVRLQFELNIIRPIASKPHSENAIICRQICKVLAERYRRKNSVGHDQRTAG